MLTINEFNNFIDLFKEQLKFNVEPENKVRIVNGFIEQSLTILGNITTNNPSQEQTDKLKENISWLRNDKALERVSGAAQTILGRMNRIDQTSKNSNSKGSVSISFGKKSHQNETHPLESFFKTISTTVKFLNEVCLYPCKEEDFIIENYNYCLTIGNVKEAGITSTGETIYSFNLQIDEDVYLNGRSNLNELIPRGLGFFVTISGDKATLFGSLLGNAKITYSLNKIDSTSTILPMKKENGKFFHYTFARDDLGNRYLLCGSKFSHFCLRVNESFNLSEFEHEIEHIKNQPGSELQYEMIRSLGHYLSQLSEINFKKMTEKVSTEKMTVFAEYCDSKHLQFYEKDGDHYRLIHLSMRNLNGTISPVEAKEFFKEWEVPYSEPESSFSGKDLEAYQEKYKEDIAQDYLTGILKEGHVLYVLDGHSQVVSMIKFKKPGYVAVRMLREFCGKYLNNKEISVSVIYRDLCEVFTKTTESSGSKYQYLKSLGFSEEQFRNLYVHFIKFIQWAREKNYTSQQTRYSLDSTGMGNLWREFIQEVSIEFKTAEEVSKELNALNAINTQMVTNRAAASKVTQVQAKLAPLNIKAANQPVIFLSGLPGAGKTILGKALVKKLNESNLKISHFNKLKMNESQPDHTDLGGPFIYLEQDGIMTKISEDSYYSNIYQAMVKKSRNKAISIYTTASKLYHDIMTFLVETGYSVITGRCNRDYSQINYQWNIAHKFDNKVFYCNLESSIWGGFRRIIMRGDKDSGFNGKTPKEILKVILYFKADEQTIPANPGKQAAFNVHGYHAHPLDSKDEDTQFPEMIEILDKMKEWKHSNKVSIRDGFQFSVEDEKRLDAVVSKMLQPTENRSEFLNAETLAQEIITQLGLTTHAGDAPLNLKEKEPVMKEAKEKEALIKGPVTSNSFASVTNDLLVPVNHYYSLIITDNSLHSYLRKTVLDVSGTEILPNMHVTLLFVKEENKKDDNSIKLTNQFFIENIKDKEELNYSVNRIAIKKDDAGQVVLVAAYGEDVDGEPLVLNGTTPSKAHITLFFKKPEVAANAGAMVREIKQSKEDKTELPKGVTVYEIDPMSAKGKVELKQPANRNKGK